MNFHILFISVCKTEIKVFHWSLRYLKYHAVINNFTLMLFYKRKPKQFWPHRNWGIFSVSIFLWKSLKLWLDSSSVNGKELEQQCYYSRWQHLWIQWHFQLGLRLLWAGMQQDSAYTASLVCFFHCPRTSSHKVTPKYIWHANHAYTSSF